MTRPAVLLLKRSKKPNRNRPQQCRPLSGDSYCLAFFEAVQKCVCIIMFGCLQGLVSLKCWKMSCRIVLLLGSRLKLSTEFVPVCLQARCYYFLCGRPRLQLLSSQLCSTLLKTLPNPLSGLKIASGYDFNSKLAS